VQTQALLDIVGQFFGEESTCHVIEGRVTGTLSLCLNLKLIIKVALRVASLGILVMTYIPL